MVLRARVTQGPWKGWFCWSVLVERGYLSPQVLSPHGNRRRATGQFVQEAGPPRRAVLTALPPLQACFLLYVTGGSAGAQPPQRPEGLRESIDEHFLDPVWYTVNVQ